MENSVATGSHSGEEWWSTFFSNLWLDVQRQVKSREQSDREAEFVERALDLERASSILDAPCGVGRLSIALARRGHHVHGIDLTEPFVEDARRAAASETLSLTFECRDMRDLPGEDRFDAAICWWGSFGYFDDEGNQDFLARAHRSLRPGGNLLIDTHVAETLLPVMSESSWKRVDDIIVLEKRVFDPWQSRTETEWTFIRGQEQYTNHTSIRLYTLREMVAELRRAGFDNIQVYGSLDGGPFALGSKRAYFVATKA